jgi:hypothetical protein
VVSGGFLRPFSTSLSGLLDLLESVAFFADLIGSLDDLDAEVLGFGAAVLLVTLSGILKDIVISRTKGYGLTYIQKNRRRNATNVQASKTARTNEVDNPILARIEFSSVKQKY